MRETAVYGNGERDIKEAIGGREFKTSRNDASCNESNQFMYDIHFLQ